MNSTVCKIKKVYAVSGMLAILLPFSGYFFKVDPLDVLKFAVSAFFIFYLPGKIVIDAMKLRASFLSDICVSLSLGLFISSFAAKIFFFFGIQHLMWLVFILIDLAFILYNIKKIRNGLTDTVEIKYTGIIICLLLLLFISVMWLLTAPSGQIHDGAMRFYRANAFDALNQWAISLELSRPYPREFPFWKGMPMVGYHTGAYYWRGLIFYLTGIDPLSLYLRLCPLFSKGLLILLLFCVINTLKGQKAAVFSVVAMFFIGDLSWLFPLIDRIVWFKDIKTVYFHGNVISLFIFNPPFVYGMIVLLTGLMLLKEAKRRKTAPIIFVSGCVFGLLMSSKAFMGLAILSSGVLVAVYEAAVERDRTLLKIFSIAILVSMATMYGMFSLSAGSVFKFAPFSILRMILADAGIISTSKYDTGNNLYSFLVFIGFFVFCAGGIGLRLPAMSTIFRHIRNWRGEASHDRILIVSLMPAFILTNTFIFNTLYARATYNFYVVFLITVSVYFAEWLAGFCKNRIRYYFTVPVLIVFMAGTTYFSALPYTGPYNKYKQINRDELEALEYLKDNSDKSACIIHNRETKPWILKKPSGYINVQRDTPGRDCFVSALSGRRVVEECSWHVGCGMPLDSFKEALKERRSDVNTLFRTGRTDIANRILEKYSVTHIWVEGDDLKFSTDILKLVFSNRRIRIYQVAG